MSAIYLMRHGQTILGELGIIQGHFDSPLSKIGKQQCADAGRIIGALNLDFVVASDLGRALQSAEIICAIAGL